MKAIVCKQFGPPEDLVLEEVPDPEVGANQVLIAVKAAGITYPDTLVIEDRYQFKAAPPFIPGGEVAGEVVAVGSEVKKLSLGDRVVSGLGLVGGFAEYAVVGEDAARLLPDAADYGASTGLLYAYGTGYYGLKYRGELRSGESLLVLGAGGQVGLAAIELGKLMGARVVAAASSDEKLSLAREVGADETINYATENLKERAKELTQGEGFNVVYDAVGGDHAEAAIRATAWGGRFLVIGFAAGIPTIPLNLALLKSCQIVGVFLGAMTAREPETREEVVGDLLEMIASGKLKPNVSRRYPLEEAPRALRDMMDRKAVGKLVVEP